MSALIDEIRIRSARPADADRVAALHADSWRRHYRGAYADSFLDGDVEAERRSAWSARLATRADGGTAGGAAETILAERDGHLVGFVHVVFDEDPRWGSLVPNLHVRHDQRRHGLGALLLRRAAGSVTRRACRPAMYLWVLERNVAAQSFYRSCGGVQMDTAPVPPPGGDPGRLVGTPRAHRMVWPDVATLIR